MALSRDAYKALQAVVGSKYVSEDPGTLAGYHYSWGGPNGRWQPFVPLAVVLPEDTSQVQGVVRVCNRYKLRFKAHSTGFCSLAFPGVEDTIMVDLRRMNRIVEIDEKNMFAVIEPYAIAAQIQAEAMKRGLDCHIVSAGPTHSPLASATSVWGIGSKGLSQSWNERNLFGVEWVLPTGEVARLGSPGVGAGWFSGDGPGPGLRGIVRGTNGAYGGNGIFTRIGLKLYPWVGDERMECTGSQPQIGLKIPERMHFSLPYWKNWEDMTAAAYKIVDNNVAFSVLRVPPDCMNWMLTSTNDEYQEAFHKGSVPIDREEHLHAWQAIIAGHSEREFEYRKKVFEQIVKDTGGKFLQLTVEQNEILFAANVRISYIPRVFRPTGDFSTSFGMEESINLMGKLHRTGENLLGKYIGPGKLPDHGREGFWAWLNEGRSLHSENAFAVTEEPGVQAANMAYVMESCRVTNSEALGVQILPGYMGIFADSLGPANFNANEWMRKVKYEVVDPDNVADHFTYIFPEPVVLMPTE
ncbi:MAG: FAD-binding oxidoreductase [Desulfuromonadaceae bacterium]|nr:FAD-binding oxidoreductase [Desulfuromonadaceae bacterium]